MATAETYIPQTSCAYVKAPDNTLNFPRIIRQQRRASATGGIDVVMREAAQEVDDFFEQRNLEFPAANALDMIRQAQPYMKHSQFFILSEPDCWAYHEANSERILRNGNMQLYYDRRVDPTKMHILTPRRIQDIANSTHHDLFRLIQLGQDGLLRVSEHGGEANFPGPRPDMTAFYDAFFQPGNGSRTSYNIAAGARHVAVHASAEPQADGSLKPVRVYLPSAEREAMILSIRR